MYKIFAPKIIARLTMTILSMVLVACGGGSGGGEDAPVQPKVQNSPPDLILESNYESFGQSRSLIVENEYLYVADGAMGLTILRQDKNKRLSRVGFLQLDPDARAYSVAKLDDIVYVAAKDKNLYVIDVSDQTSPILLNKIESPGDLSYLVLRDNKLYASAQNFFIIYELGNPESPSIEGQTEGGSPNLQFEIFEQKAYVAAYNSGIRVIDISRPVTPSIVLEKRLDFTARSLAIRQETLFVGGNGSLLAVDRNNLLNPQIELTNLRIQIPSNALSTEPFSLLVEGDYLFVANGSAGVQVIDVSGAEYPEVVSEIVTSGDAYGLAITGRNLYVADIDGVNLVDIFSTIDSDGDGVVDGADVFPNDPGETLDYDRDGIGDNADLDDDNDGVKDVDDAFPLNEKETADSDGDGIGDNEDVFPFDQNEWADDDLDGVGNNSDSVSEIIFLQLSSADSANGQARGILKNNNIVYVADGTSGLRIYEIQLDGSMLEIGLYAAVTDSVRSIALVEDKYLYVAARTNGLLVLNVENPSNPTLIATYDTPEKATFITIDKKKLYLSDRNALIIFDISNPEDPKYLGDYKAPNEFERVVIDGEMAYIAAYYSGVIVLNISDPTKPVKVMSAGSDGYAYWAIEKYDNYIFAGGEGSGLAVYEIQGGVKLNRVASLALPSEALAKPADQPPFKMERRGSFLFIADGFSGIQTVDISNPLEPRLSTEYDTIGYTSDFYIDQYTLLIGELLEGVQLINLGSNIDHDGDGKPNYLDATPLFAD